MSWYLEVMRKYAVFSGRARRKEYWMFALINTIVFIILSIIGAVLENNWAFIIYDLAVLIPSLAVTVRRLHDINKSGFWIFIEFIPIIGAIWMLVLTCTDGTHGANRFGVNPKAGEFLDVA